MTAANDAQDRLTVEDLQQTWPLLSAPERVEAIELLPRGAAESFFLSLSAREHADLMREFPQQERIVWMRMLPPDDAVDVIQEARLEERDALLALLDEQMRTEVHALLLYEEDEAGGLMNPRFARLRADMSVDESISYLRRQTRKGAEIIYYAYVVDAEQHLLGVMSFRELLEAPGGKKVGDIMHADVVKATADMPQEVLSRLFADKHITAIPVVDDQNRIQGIVSVNDIVEVVQEVATEDIQKIGGSASLDAPYLQTGYWSMLKKRAGWLCILFLGEMLTASAMGYYEHEIASAVVLALFIPLIISSGGNSGSQATTLIIRSLSLGELRLRDWWRVMVRELGTGLGLGIILGMLGILRVVLLRPDDLATSEQAWLMGITIALSLIGVVTWGSMTGSMLPFILRRFGFDPATASAPLVATLVDVTGLVIYFSIAKLILFQGLGG